MAVRVRLRYVGDEPLKVTSNPNRWVNNGDCVSLSADEAEFIVGKHPFEVVRDPTGALVKEGVEPKPQDNSGIPVGVARKGQSAGGKGGDKK